VVRRGPKRPPIAAGVRADGTGALRVARTPGSTGLERWVEAVHGVAPGLVVEEVAVPGPPVSADLRAAGWAEAAVLLGALEARAAGATGPGHRMAVVSPSGARASACIDDDGSVTVSVAAGDVLDAVVLRSYVVGAVHQALGWVRSEGIAVDGDGTVLDLTIRSFGIIPARAMPTVRVVIEDDARPPVEAGDSVFTAVAVAAWSTAGFPPAWPIEGGTT
jgi:xanthine dehydrogenase small subunit